MIKTFARPTIDELPGLVDDEMGLEASKARAFSGIECKADTVLVGNNIWMLPFVTKG